MFSLMVEGRQALSALPAEIQAAVDAKAARLADALASRSPDMGLAPPASDRRQMASDDASKSAAVRGLGGRAKVGLAPDKVEALGLVLTGRRVIRSMAGRSSAAAGAAGLTHRPSATGSRDARW